MLAASFTRDHFHHQERNDNDDEFFKDLPAKGRVNTRSRNKTKNIDSLRRIHIQGRLCWTINENGLAARVVDMKIQWAVEIMIEREVELHRT